MSGLRTQRYARHTIEVYSVFAWWGGRCPSTERAAERRLEEPVDSLTWRSLLPLWREALLQGAGAVRDLHSPKLWWVMTGTHWKFSDVERMGKASMQGRPREGVYFYFWVGGYLVLCVGRERKCIGTCQLAEHIRGDIGWWALPGGRTPVTGEGLCLWTKG